jgi:hypothetical protein
VRFLHKMVHYCVIIRVIYMPIIYSRVLQHLATICGCHQVLALQVAAGMAGTNISLPDNYQGSARHQITVKPAIARGVPLCYFVGQLLLHLHLFT